MKVNGIKSLLLCRGMEQDVKAVKSNNKGSAFIFSQDYFSSLHVPTRTG